jgi:hypothetical protein
MPLQQLMLVISAIYFNTWEQGVCPTSHRGPLYRIERERKVAWIERDRKLGDIQSEEKK